MLETRQHLDLAPEHRDAQVVDRTVADNYTEAMNLQAKLFREGQESGELRDGDPEVLALLFTGVVSAYQATDPVVVAGAPAGSERMTLAELHDVLDGAFAPPRRR